MIFRSIRFKIILWNMVLLALVSLVCGILAYNSFKFILYRNIDDLLMSRAVGIVESIDTYWEMERQSALEFGVHTGTFSKINNINFAKIASHWIETKSNDPQLLNIIIQIFNNKSKLIVTSVNLPEGQSTLSHSLPTTASKSNGFGNIAINFTKDKTLKARAFVIPVKENGQIAYFVRLITPLSDVHAQLYWFRMILFGLLPFVIFLTGIAGAFLARVSLSSVDQMITAINQITSQNFHMRINVPLSNDEIQRLAETFNSMLARIDEHFILQQRLIQDMSHEIKTPLTIMRGNMEVALKKPRHQERYESILNSSLEQITSITHIVESLLILARFDNHEVALQIKPLNINKLAKSVLSEAQILADAKNILVEFIEDAVIDIEGDETQLRSLLSNLFDNAVKYTRAQGKITIKLSKKELYALIEIKDTGIGIDAKDLPHVFERFYRVEHPEIKEKGFGLGLSLVKSIAETHKGLVSVTSRSLEGATFCISLPLSMKTPDIK